MYMYVHSHTSLKNWEWPVVNEASLCVHIMHVPVVIIILRVHVYDELINLRCRQSQVLSIHN